MQYNKASDRSDPHEKIFQFLKNANLPNDNFLDVGANIGQTIDSLDSLGARFNIHSFEPNPISFNVLQARFGERNQVTLSNYGLGKKNQKSRIFTPVIAGIAITPLGTLKKHHLNSRDMKKYLSTLAQGNSVVRRSDTIQIKLGDSLKLKPTIIKLDVEGFELEALQGMARTIGEFNPLIIFERNPSAFSYLKKIGYRIFVTALLGDEFIEVKNLSDPNCRSSIEFLAISNANLLSQVTKFNLKLST
jgi:FkbM family methyltransferase